MPLTPKPKSLTPRCVLFDLDGTLIDTAPDLGHAANCVRAELGQEPLPIEHYRPVASAGARGLLKVALDINPDHPDFNTHRESFIAHYADRIAAASAPFPGMDNTLRAFERKHLLWGVVTNKPQWLTDRLLGELNLAARAAVVVGQTEGVPLKPAPDTLLRACAALDLAPDACLYVGDDQRDITAARNAKMPVVAAGWGYVQYGEPIASWGADAILARPEDLLSFCA